MEEIGMKTVNTNEMRKVEGGRYADDKGYYEDIAMGFAKWCSGLTGWGIGHGYNVPMTK